MVFPLSDPENEIIVLDIAGGRALLRCGRRIAETQLSKMGFMREDGHLVRIINDPSDRANLVSALVEMGALFSAGPGWEPSCTRRALP